MEKFFSRKYTYPKWNFILLRKKYFFFPSGAQIVPAAADRAPEAELPPPSQPSLIQQVEGTVSSTPSGPAEAQAPPRRMMSMKTTTTVREDRKEV